MIKIITESLSGENVIDCYTDVPSSGQPQFYNMNNCKKNKNNIFSRKHRY